MSEGPLVPDYRGACIANVVPALLGPRSGDALPAWIPAEVGEADQRVLLVLDGLGWDQLVERAHLAPVLSTMSGGSIDSVCPTTTATALTSITTGLVPGEHGVVGYRIAVHGEVLNALRWSTPAGDARRRIDPVAFQGVPPFLGASVPVVQRVDLVGSAFSAAHLSGTRGFGCHVTSAIPVDVGRLLASGEPFVYAYYDGIDRAAHVHGLGEHYDAELRAVDRLVGDVLDVLPPGAVLVVTADHGQVHVGDNLVEPPRSVLGTVRLQSGEGRFRWFHARPGAAHALLEAATDAFAATTWVVPVDRVVDEGWFGPRLSEAARSRLGDVAVVARRAVSLVDPDDSGPVPLVARHGSLTPAEVRVPLLAAGPR